MPVSGSQPAITWSEIWRGLWSAFKLPIQILVMGCVVLGLLAVAHRMALPTLAGFSVDSLGSNLAALLVFMVGLGFAVFLWWLASRFFSLVSGGHLDKESMAGLKDLPMALPEGTVRAVLALIVAVIGLPLLLFSKSLGLTDAIGGYVNGIITGVFGFYFGTRTTGLPTQAVSQITEAQGRARDAERDKQQAVQERNQAVAEKQTAVASTTVQVATVALQLAASDRGGKFAQLLDVVQRHSAIADTLLNVIGPALPKDMLPKELAGTLAGAQAVLAAVKGVSKETATDDHVTQLESAAAALLSGVSPADTSGSGLGALLTQAAPLLGALPIPGLGAVAGLGMLLSVGMRLGSAEFQRWRARVLAAPIATGLIEFATVTPDDVRAAMRDAPVFKRVLGPVSESDGFYADLCDKVQRDDAVELLLTAFGPAGKAPRFGTQLELETGLSELRLVLLARRAANDIRPNTVSDAAGLLAGAAHPDLRPPQALTQADAEAIVAAASSASAAGDASAQSGSVAPETARAAFDALIMLVGSSRPPNTIDLAAALKELRTKAAV